LLGVGEVFTGALCLLWGHPLGERWRLIGKEPEETNRMMRSFESMTYKARFKELMWGLFKSRKKASGDGT